METVVKVGGILAEHPMRLKALCNKLGDLSKTHRIVVVPGGGQFADVAREFDRRFLLPSLIGHTKNPSINFFALSIAAG